MRKIIQIFKYFSLSILATCLLILGISISIPVKTNEETKSMQEKYSSSCNDIQVVGLEKVGIRVWRPIGESSSNEIYCVQPGTLLKMANTTTYKTKADIIGIINTTADSSYTSCSEASHVSTYQQYYSNTYYRCQNIHYTETSSKIGADGLYYENLYDIAYIASFVSDSKHPEETWAVSKQQAIWQSPQLVNQNLYSSVKAGSYLATNGKSLIEQAKAYKTFYEKILEVETNKDSDSYGKTGMKPNSLISKDKIILDIDNDQKIGKVGPFKLDYVYGYQWTGNMAAASFSGISNMYLLDQNGTRINIKNLIVRRANKNGTMQSSVNVVKMYDIDSDDPQEVQNARERTYFSNWNRVTKTLTEAIWNLNYIDYLAFEKAFPGPNDEFYVEFDLPKDRVVGSVKLHIEFSYLKCEATICMRDAGRYYVDDYCKGHTNPHTETGYDYCSEEDCEGHPYEYYCDDCTGRRACLGFTSDSQDGLSVEYAKRYFITEDYEIETNPSTLMKIGGFVFEDTTSGKESLANGRLDTSNDIMLKNIEVTLYEVKNNKLELAKLSTYKQENPLATEQEVKAQEENPNDYTRRINPTLTDEKGYYEFRGVDPTKKYVVKFTYNGQTYIPTEYLEGASGKNVEQMIKNKQYSSCTTNTIWNTTSKATEISSERNEYDETFVSIGSTPTNYKTSNSLNLGKNVLVNGYNEVFTTYELAGFSLDVNGNYVYNSNNQLIDTYLTVKNGKIIESKVLKEGKISQAIREYIKKYHKYPNIEEIYEDIAGKNTQTWKKLQFIEDCKISAYTKNQSADNDYSEYDQYPALTHFTTSVSTGNKYPNNSYSNGTYNGRVSTYKNNTLNKNGLASGVLDQNGLDREIQYYGQWVKSKGPVEYQNIYEGQLFINCGLWKRQKADMALQKDVYKATIKINGKTETYQYDKRNTNNYWEIQTRIEDYNSYYGNAYTRALYTSDYNYDGTNKLEVYITYKIAIRNQSEGILTQIDEVVDYYDNTYKFMNNYSWAMYDNVSITPDEYYNILTNATKVGNGKFKNVEASTRSQYSSQSEYDLNGYNTLYLSGLSGTKLESGETGYLYLTFKVNEKANKVDLGIKHNIAEINGYSTWYDNGTQLPNGITKNSRDEAGIIDYDSKPGNFEGSTSGRYEHNFEDDTDHAKGIRVYVDNNLVRTISGTVWEDARDTKVDGTDAYIANGKIDKNELKIKGIKVEMYEVLANNTLQKPTTTQANTMKKDTMETEENGTYKFEGFIPGNYIIRFTYGGKDVSATANGYNGQDYKSTTYQVEIDQNGKTNLGTDSNYYGYTDTENQNATATYGYSITKADAANANYSDAKDIWEYREKVNSYSSGSMKYELANKLNNDKTIKANELQMIAETGVIAVEGEYNRVNSDKDENSNNGYNNINYINGNDINGKYNIQNVDFGLVERPKAQLELNKQVSNVKITLANQNVLFDASQTVDNLIWQPKTEYNLTEEQKNNYYNTYNNYNKFRTDIVNRVKKIAKNQGGLIQPTMDKELTHGATIQITYDITVKNVGEVDYNDKSFYYIGIVKNENTIVKTSADILVDYVENNLKYRDVENKTEWGWKTTTSQELTNNKLVNDDVKSELSNYNTILTTSALNKKLIPLTSSTQGDANTYTKTQLILTQTITAQNDGDDMVYKNIAEIVSISNDVGRRMAFSIQGNQKPSELPQEPDSSMGEKVVILPPFGDTYLYYGLGIAAVAILAGAVIFIKKKVLKNK